MVARWSLDQGFTRGIFRRGWAALGLLALCAASALSQQDSTPPLGDVARQRPAKKAVRIFTEADLPPRPAQPPADELVDTPAEPAKDDASAPKEKDEPSAHKDAIPEKPDSQKQLDELKAHETALRTVIQTFEQNLHEPGLPDSLRQTYTDIVQRNQKQLDAVLKEKTQLQAALEAEQQEASESKTTEAAQTTEPKPPLSKRD